MQRRATFYVPAVDVRAIPKQYLHSRRILNLTRPMQRRPAELLNSVTLCTEMQQDFERASLLLMNRVVQNTPAILVADIDIISIFHQSRYCGHIA